MAEEQTEGRGRFTRRWHGGHGRSILATYVLRFPLPVDRLGLLSGGLAVAVAQTIREVTHQPAVTRWPNDVTLNGQKVAGVLPEAVWEERRLVAVLAGIGVNVNQSAAELPERPAKPASSLALLTGRPWDRGALLVRLGVHLARVCALVESDPTALLAEWEVLESLLGETVSANLSQGAVQGTVLGLNPDGALRLGEGAAEWLLPWGEVSLRQPDFPQVQE